MTASRYAFVQICLENDCLRRGLTGMTTGSMLRTSQRPLCLRGIAGLAGNAFEKAITEPPDAIPL